MRPIVLSSWSFHEALYSGHMRLWDIPEAAARLGFEAVELQDLFLWPCGNRVLRMIQRLRGFGAAPRDREYDPVLIKRIANALQQQRIHCHVWDADPSFGARTSDFDAIAYTQNAMRVAARLGASIVRVTVDHETLGESIDAAVEALRMLVPHAEKLGVRLAVENHAARTDSAPLLELMRSLDSPRVGLCLDFGNIASQADFAALAPYAIHAHAKCYAFDEAGEETNISYGERLHTLAKAGYEGAISIEYEGDGSPERAIRAAKVLIQRAGP